MRTRRCVFPVLNGGSTYTRSIEPSGIVRSTSRQSPWRTRFVTTRSLLYTIDRAMQTTLSSKRVNAVLEHVDETARLEPAGDLRRPVHVVYGGAHLFQAGTPAKLGRLALASMEEHGGTAKDFASVVGLADESRAEDLVTRVKKKLERDAVEAYCIDFEDGYGPRADDEEDADAVRTANDLAKSHDEEQTVGEGSTGGAPIVGIRIKPLAGASGRRAARTL